MWTHLAFQVSDLERSLSFYTDVAPLVVVQRRESEGNKIGWLSNDKQVETPFVLVLAQFGPELSQRFNFEPGKPLPTLAPFAHIGIELPSREEVDAISELGAERGILRSPASQRDETVGYACSIFDPDGNVVEFSYDQKVYSTIRELWGSP
ncbi:VOC family protein [Novosphingobium endophyticum]|nr:VOC family protein [Novosphingobium endophyticum]